MAGEKVRCEMSNEGTSGEDVAILEVPELVVHSGYGKKEGH